LNGRRWTLTVRPSARVLRRRSVASTGASHCSGRQSSWLPLREGREKGRLKPAPYED